MNERLAAEDRMAEVLAAYLPHARALLLAVLTIRDDAARARRIGELHADERSRGFAELLIDLEENPAAKAFRRWDAPRDRTRIKGIERGDRPVALTRSLS